MGMQFINCPYVRYLARHQKTTKLPFDLAGQRRSWQPATAASRASFG